MTHEISKQPKGRSRLTARRLVLLATAAGVGGAVMVAGPSAIPTMQAPLWASGATAAENIVVRPGSFADVVERVKPAVFAVRVKFDQTARAMPGDDEDGRMERFFRRFGFGPEAMPNMPRERDRDRMGPRSRPFSMSQGSGFFISADGYAVTNNHVIERGQTVEIRTDDGRSHTAKVVATDPRTDLALLKVDGRDDFPYVNFAERTPRIGDWVLAVGNPFGLGGTVTAGIVSGNGRNIGAGPYDDFIQIDAPVNKGNSGGPTFDVDGNVIGVNTAIYSPSGGNVGIAFAIPANTAKQVVQQLREKGTVTRGWIGVHIQTVTPDIAESMGLKQDSGVLVAEAQPGSPAEKAGLAARDLIVSVDGTPVKTARDLAMKISAMAPGSNVKIGYLRDGQERTAEMTLGELPNERQARAGEGRRGGGEPGGDAATARLGLQLAPAGTVAGAGSEGVVVTQVEPGSPAAEQGFRVGDVVLDIGGRQVSNPADARRAIADAQSEGKRTVLLRVKSGDALRFVAVPLRRG